MENVTNTAKKWWRSDFLILDTETTGLGEDAEVVEIGVIDKNGKVVFEQLIKPSKPIPEEATAIHGITNEDVKDAPVFDEVLPIFIELLSNKKIIAYNSKYDNRVLVASCRSEKKAKELSALLNFQSRFCLMELFAEWYGEKKEDGNFKWQSLIKAASFFGVDTTDAHRATADALMALEVLKGMRVRRSLFNPITTWSEPDHREVTLVLDKLGLPANRVARMVGVSGDRTVRRWKSGESPISYSAWAIIIAETYKQHIWKN